MSRDELIALLPYAAPRQRQVIKMRLDGKSWTDIERELDLDGSGLRKSLRSLKRRAVRQGYIQEHGLNTPLPDGLSLERATIQRGPDGEIERTWTKAKTDSELRMEILAEKLEAGENNYKKYRPSKPPAHLVEDLLSCFVVTDFHLGMYAWEAESGESWDSEIARNVLLNAVKEAISSCPKSQTGLFCQLGDFLHFDGILAVTPQSGHLLDADTRYGKLVELAIEVMGETIRLMLKRFGNVHVIQAEGNHDIAGSVWLRKHIKHVFANEPRVTVDDSEFPYYAYAHGETMLGFHHGHKMKLAQLHKLFASEPRFRKMWGDAKYTYIHSGHLHHERVIEDGGAIAEMHPTLAARDAYAARGGWQSQRGAKIITYHKTLGEMHRVTVRPNNGNSED